MTKLRGRSALQLLVSRWPHPIVPAGQEPFDGGPLVLDIVQTIEEAPMRIAKSMAVAAVFTLIGSATWAAEEIKGKITKLDKANHQITLQLGTPGQTVGSASAPTQIFSLTHDLSYDTLAVGEQVTVKVEEVNGVRQITKWEKK